MARYFGFLHENAEIDYPRKAGGCTGLVYADTLVGWAHAHLNSALSSLIGTGIARRP